MASSSYGRGGQIKLSHDLEMLLDDLLSEGSQVSLDYGQLRLLFQSLKEQEAWHALAEASSAVIERGKATSDIVATYLQALRGTGQHENALEVLPTLPKDVVNQEVLTQWGAILCEAGDFVGALDLLTPVSPATIGDYSDDMLSLMGWAHQNSIGSAHALSGIEVYRVALQKLTSTAPQDDMLTEGKHPGIFEGAQQYRRDPYKIKSLWYRKGYGDTLGRLPDTRAAGEAEWRRVLMESEPDIHLQRADPLILRVAGWCHFCLAEYEQSIAAYRRAIVTRISIFRTQFDYALVLCAKGNSSTAVQQYRRAIADAVDLGPLRRAGLLRVALFELYRIVTVNEALRSKTQIGAIWRGLMDSFLSSCSEIRPSLADTKDRLRQAAEELSERFGSPGDSRLTAITGTVDWETSQVVGIPSPEPQACGLFMPVLEFPARDGERFVLDRIDASASSDRPWMSLSICPPDFSIKELITSEVASPLTRVVYLSREALRVLREFRLDLPRLARGRWICSRDSADELLACTFVEEGTSALEGLANSGAKALISVLASSSGLEDSLNAELAKLCFFAARRPETIYVSALCFALLHQEHPDPSVLRRDLRPGVLPPPIELVSCADRFLNLIRHMPQNGPAEWDSKSFSLVIVDIISRAAEITLIKDLPEQIQKAIWAAAEIRAILPEGLVSRELQEHTALRLSGATALYLTDTFELLGLSIEPALYCSIRSSSTGEPTLDVISFFRSSTVIGEASLLEKQSAR